MCRARATRPASPRCSSCRPTRRRSARARRRSRPTTRSAGIWRTIRTAPRPSCARRSAARFGLDPNRIVCGAGSDDILNLLARAYLQDGDEAIHTTHGFLVYPIATLGAGATPVVAPGEGFHRRRRRDPRQGDAAHQDRVPGEPEQSDRHLHSVRRGEAPARRPAAARAARDRCGLRRIRAAQRLRVRHRAGGDVRERRDDAHLLEDLWPRGPAPRLALRAGARRRCAQSHPRTVQRRRAVDRGRRRGDRRHRACGEFAPAQREMARLDHGGDPQARADGDAERRQFHPDPLPRDQGQDREGRRRAAHLARRRDARGRAPITCRTRCA